MNNLAAILPSSLFTHKGWANRELFVQVDSIDVTNFAAQQHGCIRVLNHVLVVDQIFAAHLCQKAPAHAATNTPPTPTLAQLLDAVVEVVEVDAWYLAYVATVSPEALQQPLTFVFTDSERGRMTRAEMLTHVVTRGGYHRGAVGEILKGNGRAAPRDFQTRYLYEKDGVRRIGYPDAASKTRGRLRHRLAACC